VIRIDRHSFAAAAAARRDVLRPCAEVGPHSRADQTSRLVPNRRFGKVYIPQEAFIAALKVDS